ncbi:hypothetical protein QBC32DRAFT_332222 [Pseudoneurospora amorphoporcata]|uniref:Uncharacterized protein n=1 Tax=Pseudoneurospora amorphoporcata TaxID=241081 RepID=A0AAN6P5P1_9PEZI|nr:hypothetical protein QBC32DRAFT_332222 [Pseudoneurospora amorphoporcata]
MMLAHFQSGPLPHLVAPTTPTINTASTMEMPGYGYGMMDHQRHQNMHNYHNNNTISIQQQYVAPQPAPCSRKRKADSQPENNERLSKRMSLLNLEHGGQKLYVPVENPQAANSFEHSFTSPPSSSSSSSYHTNQHVTAATGQDDTEFMQLDDSKYKVYIYNLEDELSSESEAEGQDGKLIFLPDIEKHLKQNRIPTQVLNAQPSVDPDYMNKQLVLYSVPASITVPEEQDSVRKAILEARARMREKHLAESQMQQQEQMQQINNGLTDTMQSIHPGSLPQYGGDQNDDAMELD